MNRVFYGVVGCAMLGMVIPASGLDHCTAKISLKDGTILVAATSISGTLLWGTTAGNEINPMADDLCVSGGVAKTCKLGTGAVAIMPPALCTLYLKDDIGACSAFIKKCTPGARPLVELPSRFVDNGDGTVTDTQTGLMWEQKTGTAQGAVDCSTTPCDDPRDVNDTYRWSTSGTAPDGGVFTDFLARVNGTLCADPAACSGLGGHSDWRLPTLAELEAIIDLTASGCGLGDPCIYSLLSPAAPGFYWSSTTYTWGTNVAWRVGFGGGAVSGGDKRSFSNYVRAVRGGS